MKGKKITIQKDDLIDTLERIANIAENSMAYYAGSEREDFIKELYEELTGEEIEEDED
jgi:hypothetical protein